MQKLSNQHLEEALAYVRQEPEFNLFCIGDLQCLSRLFTPGQIDRMLLFLQITEHVQPLFPQGPPVCQHHVRACLQKRDGSVCDYPILFSHGYELLIKSKDGIWIPLLGFHGPLHGSPAVVPGSGG